jgi:fumarate reductase subunit D
MSFLATLGIILMIVDNELTFSSVDNDDTRAGWYIKPIITFTTIILLGLILYYHYLDLKLYAVQNCLEDCRVVLTKTKIYLIITEILICAIHPVPHNSLYADSLTFNLNTNSSSSYPLSYITLDVALGLPSKFFLYIFLEKNK